VICETYGEFAVVFGRNSPTSVEVHMTEDADVVLAGMGATTMTLEVAV